VYSDFETWVRGHSGISESIVWNRSARDFLLTFLGNYGPISYRFRDKVRFQSKIANGPVYFAPPMKGSSWNWVSALGSRKLESWRYRAEKDVWWYLQPYEYDTVHRTRTWRTDGRTDTGRQQRPR